MFSKIMTYTDFDGNERTETFYFNLSKAEVAEMQLSEDGGFDKFLQKIVEKKDTKELIKLFKYIILKAYGEKSADGRHFIKSEKISEEFSQSAAYSDIFMEFATDDKAAAAFIKGILPADMTIATDAMLTDTPAKAFITNNIDNVVGLSSNK